MTIFRGDRLWVVDKPAGPTSEAVAAALGAKLAHRLDAATSGLLVVADDARTIQRLHRQLAAGDVSRVYRLVVHGAVAPQTITSVLHRNRGDGLRGTIRLTDGVDQDRDDDTTGKAATTIVRALWSDPARGVSGAEATLVTGRTHQVRIQLAEAGHMLVGEPVYRRDHVARGQAEVASARLMLHAWRLTLRHPNTHEPLALEAPLPPGFEAETSG